MPVVQADPRVIEAVSGALTVLSIQNLSSAYGAIQVLDDITMVVPAGRITCILGRNGVGKTTLLMNIMGLLSRRWRGVHGGYGHHGLAGRSAMRPSGSAWCRRAAVFSPSSRLKRISAWRSRRAGDAKDPIPEEVYDLFPAL